MNPLNAQTLTERVQAAVQNLITPVEAVQLAGQLDYSVLDFMERYAGRVAWSIDDLDRLAVATDQHIDRFLHPLPVVDPHIITAAFTPATLEAAEQERMLIIRELLEDLNYATLKVAELLLPGPPNRSPVTG